VARLGYLARGGGFLFAFGLPVTAQEAHAQLFYRFGVRGALALIEFGSKERSGRWACSPSGRSGSSIARSMSAIS